MGSSAAINGSSVLPSPQRQKQECSSTAALPPQTLLKDALVCLQRKVNDRQSGRARGKKQKEEEQSKGTGSNTKGAERQTEAKCDFVSLNQGT